MRKTDMYRIVLTLVAVGILSTAGWADVIDTLTLGATQDAWCETYGDDAGSGTDNRLYVQTAGDKWKAFIQFDVSTALSNAGYTASQIDGATLHLRVDKVYMYANEDCGFGVRYVESSWSEGDYDASPTPDAPSLGDWLDDHTWAQVGSSGEYDGGWVEFDVTAAAQAWANGTKTNYGVALDAIQHDWLQRDIRIWSSEGTYPTLRPYLTIDITPEPATLSLLAAGGLGILLRRKKYV